MKDETPIADFDFGAGTRTNIKSKTIKNLAATSLSSPKKGRLLGHIVQYLNCKNILEIGTSLGISTAYLASGDRNAKVLSLEGNPDLVMKAKKTAFELNLTNIQFIEGNFDETLPKLLQNISNKIDFVFLDGNHRFESTIQYFEMLLPHLHHNAVLVIDDIYWSAEMTQAWSKIISDSKVTISLDLYVCGIVFISDNYSKQHFTLKF